MMHRENMYDSFRRNGSVLRYVDVKSDVNDTQSGYDCDVREKTEDDKWVWQYQAHWEKTDDQRAPLNPRVEAEILPQTDETFIYTVICTVKAQHSVSAMRNIRHRVDSRSTVLLMQNGLGQIDELIEEVFTDPKTRPTFLIGVISHGCHMAGSTTVRHAGFGVTSLGIYRDASKHPLPPKSLTQNLSELTPEQRILHYPSDAELYATSLSARYLLRTITRSPTLACAAYPYLDLLQLQLEKLSSNALINPLTAIYDVPNGATLTNPPLSTIQNMLAAELSLIIRLLPELATIPGLSQRFSAERLKALATNLAEKTAKNSSSMREDMRRARPTTEIDYINGYIVKRGREVGVQAAVNFMVVQLMKAKMLYKAKEDAEGEVPLVAGRVEGRISEDGQVVLEDVSGRGTR
jgi:2-dehydropantoate 2-reductase